MNANIRQCDIRRPKLEPTKAACHLKYSMNLLGSTGCNILDHTYLGSFGIVSSSWPAENGAESDRISCHFPCSRVSALCFYHPFHQSMGFGLILFTRRERVGGSGWDQVLRTGREPCHLQEGWFTNGGSSAFFETPISQFSPGNPWGILLGDSRNGG